MKEKLIRLGFEKWLGEQELAHYLVMFWDTPKFIQLAYVQKFLREEKKVDIYILGYGFGYYAQLNNVPPANQGEVKYVDRRWNMPPKGENSGNLRTYEEALEVGILKAIEDDK